MRVKGSKIEQRLKNGKILKIVKFGIIAAKYR